MSSVPFTKTTKDEEKEDNDRYDRYTKGFIAMTTITAITALIIMVACFLYVPAKCDTPGEKSIFFQITCKIIGSEYDPENPGILGCILFALAFGWFIILSMFLLDTRPMIDFFNSTETLTMIKSYLVYPFLILLGIVLPLGIVAFIPLFGLHRFVDQKTSEDKERAMPFTDSDSILTKLVRRLKLTMPLRRLYSNFINLLGFATMVSRLGAVALIIAALVLFILYVSKQFVGGITNIFKVVLIVIGILVASAIVMTIYESMLKKERDYENMQSNSIVLLLLKVIRYIPCLIIDAVNWIRHELNITTRPVWILLLIEAAIVGIYFFIPFVLNSTIFSGSTSLTEDIVDTSVPKQLETLESVGIVRTPECATKLKTKHSYALSGWVFISSHPPSMTSGGNTFVNILDFNGVPRIEYNAATNELRFRIKMRKPSRSSGATTLSTTSETDKTTVENTAMSLLDFNHEVDEGFEAFEAFNNMMSGAEAAASNEAASTRESASSTASVISGASSGAKGWAKANIKTSPEKDKSVKTLVPPEDSVMVTIYTMSNFPLQRWNHLVYNYDGSNIDIFINNKLVTSVTNKFPLIEHGNIVSGASMGVIGNLTNVVAFSNHLTKDVITGIYTKEDPRGFLWSAYSNTRVDELMHNV
jgi:hypothetical protein